MNLIKAIDIDGDIIYLNTDVINQIIIGDENLEEKYLVILSNGTISVKESNEIDRIIEDCDWIENMLYEE
ncbi:hypothetical protein [Anaerococcus hydrogenalis]|jgi:hypothetical protein|uniref:hypothetical protein n=1 Tax=Anaerococcus hydrogenalis TaxID=33029 RepID=UPI002902E3E9|nr:hypothetical protein [Anaerococcus hydrogenalis]MDU1315689.1 hypothetical protein [Anaerococcus hydrogenalis]